MQINIANLASKAMSVKYINVCAIELLKMPLSKLFYACVPAVLWGFSGGGDQRTAHNIRLHNGVAYAKQ